MSVKLPVATDLLSEGPILRLGDQRLTVEYAHLSANGAAARARIQFEEVLAVDYRDWTCASPESITGFREVRSLEKSRFLESVLETWASRSSTTDDSAEQAGASRFRHFTVWFDDIAAIDVIAASCRAGDSAK